MNLISNKTEKVSIYKVLSDFYEDNGIVQTDADESVILKWAEDKASDIISDRDLVHRLAWLSVYNYKAEIPRDLKIINEIAYKKTNPKASCDIRGYQIVQYAENTHDCEVTYNVNCTSCNKVKRECECAAENVVVDINRSFEISHPEMFYSKYSHVGRFGYGNSIYSDEFKLLTPQNNNFFNISKYIPECANLNIKSHKGESYIINPPIIDTSFEKGELLVSYMGILRSQEGYLLIPDHRDVYEAILQYLTYKWYRREYLTKRDPSDRAVYQEAKMLCDEATNKAISRLTMPSFEEFCKVWSNSKWAKIENAYSNHLKGEAPFENISSRTNNPYRS